MNTLLKCLAATGLMSCLGVMPVFSGVNLEKLLEGSDVWKRAPDAAVDQLSGEGFRWMEENRKRDYRWVKLGATTGDVANVFMFGEQPVEVIMRFKDEKLSAMMSLFYSRGDSGGMKMEEFSAKSNELMKKLDAWAGSKGIPQKSAVRDGGRTVARGIWVRGDVRVDLESGYTKSRSGGRPEFIRVRVLPFDPSQRAQLLGGRVTREAPKANARHGAALAMDIKKGVQNKPNGDRVIIVPMVDQGPKGYCVAAVMERMAQFYGKVFDQHDAAQLANTSAAGGTSTENLVKALHDMSALMKMNCSGVSDIDETVAKKDPVREVWYSIPKEFYKMLKDYNREAKRAGLPEREIWEIHQVGSFNGIYNLMDRDIFRKVRLKNSVKAEQFKKAVKKHIDTGVPVIWVVLVGMVPEEGRGDASGVGGHMRMIVGYNQKSGEFIYSDTWGPGHEEKRMSMDDAWVMNRGYFVIKPQGTRL